MHARSFVIPLLVTSSVFLVHCSSGDDDSGNQAGAGGSAGQPSTAAGTGGTTTGTGGTTSGSAGMTSNAAGTGGSGGSTATGGSGGTTPTAGQGGSGGSTSGQGGRAGSMAGASGRGTAGGAGTGSAGRGSGGMSGASGSAGSGTSGMGAGGAASGGRSAGGNGGTGGVGAMTLTSSVITEGGMFPDENTCAGANTSPDLTWSAGPSGTMSYAVILLDTSNSLNHWVLWDIPASVTALPAMLDKSAMLTMPAGAKQKAVSGTGYFGPCPSGMDHVYKFTVYALPVATLSGAMTSSQTSALATAVMNANPLASASLSAHSSASQAN